MDLPRPFDVLDTFGRKSKSKASRALKFGIKQVPIEVNNWWKFGVDISNHFWEIQNLAFLSFNSSPNRYKNNFQKLFYTYLGMNWKDRILDFSKVVGDINTKFLPVVNLYENPLCAKNQGHRCSKFGFPAKNVKNF